MLLTQDEVIDKILTANNAQEVAEARDVRDEWMREHPGDLTVLDAAESLEETADSLGLPANKERSGAA